MAHLAAVAHYTAMAVEARNLRVLHAAQTAYDNLAEPDADDDALTPADAHDQAVAELMTCTESLADWLAKKCDCDQGRAPINTDRLSDVDLIDSDRVPVLLAALFGGTSNLQGVAIERLRTLYLQAERKTVAARAAELLAGQ